MHYPAWSVEGTVVRIKFAPIRGVLLQPENDMVLEPSGTDNGVSLEVQPSSAGKLLQSGLSRNFRMLWRKMINAWS